MEKWLNKLQYLFLSSGFLSNYYINKVDLTRADFQGTLSLKKKSNSQNNVHKNSSYYLFV